MDESLHIPMPVADSQTDTVEASLRGIAQNLVMVVFGLLPIFFIPIAYAPFAYSKVIAVIFIVLVSIIFFSLSVLRSGNFRLPLPWGLGAFWGVALVAVVSAALSGDTLGAFVGDTLGVQTAFFIVLMAMVMTIPALTRQNKNTIMRMYILLTGSALLLGAFHILRFIFGVHFLSFGIFTSVTATPIGSWNDLGLFAGLCVLLSLVALEQLPLTRPGKILFSTVVGMSLILLAVVNFFAVWLVLGLVSLVLLMYSLTKQRFTSNQISAFPGEDTTSAYSVSISAVVFVASLLFVIGGATIGNFVSNAVGVNYIEVRPSLQSTLDIGRQVYAHSALLGIGPNKFIDAWRLYKSNNINQTLFWSTDFTAGSGYVTTQFVTMGLLGIVAWISFLVLFLWTGFRMLFRSSSNDRFWYFIGTSSFVTGVYFWGMSVMYNPGAVILLLAALFSGITFVAYSNLVGTRTLAVSVSTNRRSAFALVGAVMVVIIVSTSVLYYAGRHYTAVYQFNRAVSQVTDAASIPIAEQGIATAYTSNPSPAYARQLASYEIYTMNQLRAIQKPTSDQQQQFQTAAAKAVNAARLAVQDNDTDPTNWSTLGTVYGILAAVGVNSTSTKQLALDAFAKAKQFDPQNPVYDYLVAQLDSQTNDLASARTAINNAIQLKPDYTDALYLLSQIDIAEGQVADAITTTRSIITLDPNNPGRYFQLGVLEASNKDTDAAIAAFQKAVSLDTTYANARYMLALAYLAKNDPKDALDELNAVLQLNPGNEQVTSLIDQIKNGAVNPTTTSTTTPTGSTTQVTDPSAVSKQNGAVTTTEAPNTSLVAPVNTVPSHDRQGTTSRAQ